MRQFLLNPQAIIALAKRYSRSWTA